MRVVKPCCRLWALAVLYRGRLLEETAMSGTSRV